MVKREKIMSKSEDENLCRVKYKDQNSKYKYKFQLTFLVNGQIFIQAKQFSINLFRQGMLTRQEETFMVKRKKEGHE